jgi:predicted nucleic acid-binding protein
MPAPDFLDTNILVYAYDSSDRRKQEISQDLVRKAVAGEILVSTQVLGEFATTLLHKISPRARPRDVAAALEAMSPARLVALDGDLVRRAVEAHAQFGVHFYDGLIIAAAERGGCARIFSEDLNAGQKYFGIAVVNPFRSAK